MLLLMNVQGTQYTVQMSGYYGMTGGTTSFRGDCPTGTYVYSISGTAGWGLDTVRFSCSGGQQFGPFGSSTGGNTVNPIMCNAGFNKFDLRANVGGSFFSAQPYCNGTSTQAKMGDYPTWSSGTLSTFSCPAGNIITSVGGNFTSYILSLSFGCTPLAALNPICPVRKSLKHSRHLCQ